MTMLIYNCDQSTQPQSAFVHNLRDNDRDAQALCVKYMRALALLIKWDQLNPWIKDQLGKALLSKIWPLQLPDFVSMWEGQALPHDTKFGNCRCEAVNWRVIFIRSLIHGSSWSSLIKAEPGRKRQWKREQNNGFDVIYVTLHPVDSAWHTSRVIREQLCGASKEDGTCHGLPQVFQYYLTTCLIISWWHVWPSKSNRPVSHMRALLAACHELEVDYDTWPNMLYDFGHKA